MGCENETNNNVKKDKTSEGNNGNGGFNPMKTGMGMMNKMMGGMKDENSNPMKTGMGMMNKMMGGMKDENFNPMEMCRKITESVAATAEIAGLATPEVRALFEDWASEVEKEILTVIKKEGQINPLSIAEKFNISEDSALYFVSKLVRDNKIRVNAEFADKTSNEKTAQTGAKTESDVAVETSSAANTECAGGACSVETAAADTKENAAEVSNL